MLLRYGLLALTIAACGGAESIGGGGGGGRGSGGGFSASVAISSTAYSPGDVSVKAGGAVTWTNNDPVTHSVTSDASGTFNSDLAGTMPSMDPYSPPTGGGTFQYTFASPGSYPYHCIHHATMHGTVTVTP